jgi:hypothetical protein
VPKAQPTSEIRIHLCQRHNTTRVKRPSQKVSGERRRKKLTRRFNRVFRLVFSQFECFVCFVCWWLSTTISCSRRVFRLLTMWDSFLVVCAQQFSVNQAQPLLVSKVVSKVTQLVSTATVHQSHTLQLNSRDNSTLSVMLQPIYLHMM